MKFETAYNKPNSFFKGKKAKVIQEVRNGLDEVIETGVEVTINKKSDGFKIFFDIVSDSGVYMYRVPYDALELIKNENKNEKRNQ